MSAWNALDGQWVAALLLMVFVAFMVPNLLLAYSGRIGRGFMHMLIWLELFLVLIIGYTYRAELMGVADRVSSELRPAGQGVTAESPDGRRSVRIRRTANGPFVARATVNGAEMRMLVDTGASSVVLKSADAEQAGIDLTALSFTVAVETANGTTFCAPVRLKQISVGGISFGGVEALVAKPGNLKESLLGMTFLKRLRSYDFSGDFVTLRS